MVGMHVGFDDMRNPHRLLVRGLQIGADLELWIHHSGNPVPPSAEQIGRAPGFGFQELAEDHWASLPSPASLGVVILTGSVGRSVV